MTRLLAPIGLAAVVLGCSPKPTAGPVAAQADESTAPVCDPNGPMVDFPTSPGGTPEAPPELVQAEACHFRIVDVREREELGGELGAIDGAVHIPQRRVAAEAVNWDLEDPIILVCRSGRRSGAVARELQLMGFTNVASMTGGMIAWHDHGLPTIDGANLRAPSPVKDRAHRRPVSRNDVAAHIADRDQVRWTKAASLILDGMTACVDGRDAHAIVGTPGGDAGELVLALASAEKISGKPFAPEKLEEIFDAYLEAFGFFYMHTDDHAVAALMDELAAATKHDPAVPDGHDPAAAERFLLSPPEHLRPRLLELLVDPEFVGCGHLRLMLQHPEDYDVRPEVTAHVIQTFYRHLWNEHPAIEFVVLHGGHEESAVVTVELANEVHSYTRIPLVSPRLQDTEIFVAHPQVARFIRHENVAFFLEHRAVQHKREVNEDEFFAELERLAGQQLAATLRYLAPDLPHFTVRFDHDDFEVVGPTNPQQPNNESSPQQ